MTGVLYTSGTKKHIKYGLFAMCNEQGTQQRSHLLSPRPFFAVCYCLGTRQSSGLCRVQLPWHTAKIQTLPCAMPGMHTANPPSTSSVQPWAFFFLPWVSLGMCPISCTRQRLPLPMSVRRVPFVRQRRPCRVQHMAKVFAVRI